MEISGAAAPAVPLGVLSSRRMKPESSVLAMSTAAASAAMAFSTCKRRLYVGWHGCGPAGGCQLSRGAVSDSCEQQHHSWERADPQALRPSLLGRLAQYPRIRRWQQLQQAAWILALVWNVQLFRWISTTAPA